LRDGKSAAEAAPIPDSTANAVVAKRNFLI
jgi:hypothetical protein